MQKRLVYGLIIIEVIILLIIFASQMLSPVYLSNVARYSTYEKHPEIRAAVTQVWTNYGEIETDQFVLHAPYDYLLNGSVQPEDHHSPHALFYRNNFPSEDLTATIYKDRATFSYVGKQNTFAKAKIICQQNGTKLGEYIDSKGINKEIDPVDFCGDTNYSPCCVIIPEKLEQITRPNILLNSLLPLAIIILIIIELSYLAYLRYKNGKENFNIFIVANIPFSLLGISMVPFILNPFSLVWGLAMGGILALALMFFTELPLLMTIFSIIKLRDIRARKFDKTILIFTIILLIYYLAALLILLGSMIGHIY